MKIRFDSPENRDPGREKGIRVPYAPAKRKSSQWRWYLILLLVCSPLIYFFVSLGMSVFLVSASGFVSLEPVTINSAAAGILKNILVDVGDNVVEGEKVAVSVNPELDEREYVLRSELRGLNGSFSDEEGVATTAGLLQQRIGLAKKQADYRLSYLEKVRQLFKNGAATIAELNLAKAQLNQSLYTLNEAKASLYEHQERTGGQTATSDRSVLARTERLQAELQAVDQQHGRLIQKTPYAGRIIDIMASEGEILPTGAPLMIIGRTDHPSVVAYLDPKHARYALAGQDATVHLPDGTRLPVRVRDKVRLTRRLPADAATDTGSRERMLLVELDFLEELGMDKRVEGLPVKVRFD